MNATTRKTNAPAEFPSLAVLALTLSLAVAATSCATGPDGSLWGGGMGPEYKPANVYVASKQLPPTLKRVAVLPLAVNPRLADREAIQQSLSPILLAELAKTGRFEMVSVSPATLVQLSGRGEWRTTDPFPTNLVAQIREATACDAVLFPEVTDYRPYPPVAVGWKVQLLDPDTLQAWWAVDELFDASDPAVANSARRYHLAHTAQPRTMTDAREVLNSPVRFGRYAASVVAETCPSR